MIPVCHGAVCVAKVTYLGAFNRVEDAALNRNSRADGDGRVTRSRPPFSDTAPACGTIDPDVGSSPVQQVERQSTSRFGSALFRESSPHNVSTALGVKLSRLLNVN